MLILINFGTLILCQDTSSPFFYHKRYHHLHVEAHSDASNVRDLGDRKSTNGFVLIVKITR